jgi:hypothetical protein
MRIILVISEEDIITARKMSYEWSSTNARFSSEDAFQEMMLRLLERGDALRNKGMRYRDAKLAARNASIEASYLMRVPQASHYKQGGAPFSAKDTGLSLSVEGNVPDEHLLASEDRYQDVTNHVALQQVLDSLNDKDRARLLAWAARPSSQSGTSLTAVKKTIAKLQAVVEGEGS